MKKVICPRCDNYLYFDEHRLNEGNVLCFICPSCGRQFSQTAEELRENESEDSPYGSITFIENQFGYKQEFSLNLGENTIGRRSKGTEIQIPVISNDPSFARQHCVITIKLRNNQLQAYLHDFPSMTGTFLRNELLGKKEKALLRDGDVVSVGATTFIVHLPVSEDDDDLFY